ncbi:hypothetical protein, partial [Pyrobaculum aerophilum]|uniref:hypothetical protein n=1 Tax=Pyrobaculum aerophilum TaxID=13773 RepID=UPI001C6F540D
GAAKGVFELHGRELYHNPLYESLLPYLGWREWKALLQAPRSCAGGFRGIRLLEARRYIRSCVRQVPREGQGRRGGAL